MSLPSFRVWESSFREFLFGILSCFFFSLLSSLHFVFIILFLSISLFQHVMLLYHGCCMPGLAKVPFAQQMGGVTQRCPQKFWSRISVLWHYAYITMQLFSDWPPKPQPFLERCVSNQVSNSVAKQCPIGNHIIEKCTPGVLACSLA